MGIVWLTQYAWERTWPQPRPDQLHASRGVWEVAMLGQTNARGRSASSVSSAWQLKSPKDARIGVRETVMIGKQSARGKTAKNGAQVIATIGPPSAHGKTAGNVMLAAMTVG